MKRKKIEEMSITTWKGHDRLAAYAAINLSYNVL